MEGVQRCETGLTVFDRQEGFEAGVDIAQYRLAGPEIGGDGQDAVRGLSQECPPSLNVGGHVCAAEPIDRLFGVADQEESTWPDLKLGPVVVRRAGRGVPAKPPEDFGLERVSVLELID